MPFTRGLFRGFLTLSLGAYFGAVAMSAIAAMTIFQTLDPDRTTAGLVAGKMFARLDMLTTVLVIATLISTVGALLTRNYARARAVSVSLGVILLAAGWAVSVFWMNPRIARLQEEGLTREPVFKKLHKTSERSLSLQGALAAVLVFAAAGGNAGSDAPKHFTDEARP